MMTDKNSPQFSSARWLWLFPPIYLVHIIEERWGVGAPHGINLSLKAFVILTGVGLMLMIVGVVLALRLGFPEFLAVCLGTLFFVNALSHIANCIYIGGYDAGVITGTLLFIPLGLITLISLRKRLRPKRYFTALAIGLVIQAIAMILAY